MTLEELKTMDREDLKIYLEECRGFQIYSEDSLEDLFACAVSDLKCEFDSTA